MNTILNFCRNTISSISIITVGLFLFSRLQAQDKLELNDFIGGDKLTENSFSDVIPSKTGNYYFIEEGNKIVLSDFETGKTSRTLVDYVDDSIINIGNPEGFEITNDEKSILFYTSVIPIYRYSFTAKYFLYSIENKQITLIADTAQVRDVSISPDGKWAAWVNDNNLFSQNLQSNEIKQLTFDGKADSIINGAPDWVYEEEFTLKKAFEWSPDGQYLAYLKFDEHLVPEYPLTYYDSENAYPVIEPIKYPKPGENISKVELWVYNVSTKKHTKINTGEKLDSYIPRFSWSKQNGKLSFVKMNRLQNELSLMLADVAANKVELLYAEKNARYIDELPEKYPWFINSSNDFLITSESDGYNNVYLRKFNKNELQPITQCKFELKDILDFDEKTETLYFTSHANSPIHTIVQSVSLKNGTIATIGPSTGTNDAIFSGDFKHYILKHSNSKQPLLVTLCSENGGVVDTLLNNSELEESVRKGKVPLKDFFQITTNEGLTLNAWILKPVDFNSTKKYPVLLYVYGGPGIQTVTDSWKINWLNYLAMQGYIVVSADNRGSAGRGAAFKKQTYGHLGDLETKDQIEIARYMGKQSYVDANRIGVYGWSFGGYMASMCILQGADVFKAAIAVAPPSHWKFYDAVYTERYMGLPSANPTGYESSSVLSYTPLLKGKFLLIHGTADDNVHIQHSMVFADALIRDNKPFEMFYYPNKNHSIKGGNTSQHLFSKMLTFLKENL